MRAARRATQWSSSVVSSSLNTGSIVNSHGLIYRRVLVYFYMILPLLLASLYRAVSALNPPPAASDINYETPSAVCNGARLGGRSSVAQWLHIIIIIQIRVDDRETRVLLF